MLPDASISTPVMAEREKAAPVLRAAKASVRRRAIAIEDSHSRCSDKGCGLKWRFTCNSWGLVTRLMWWALR